MEPCADLGVSGEVMELVVVSGKDGDLAFNCAKSGFVNQTSDPTHSFV